MTTHKVEGRIGVFTGVALSVSDSNSGSDLLCEYHGDLWNILTLQGWATVFVKEGTALMRLL